MELVSYVLLVVMGIVPIANPFSTAPLFIAMTAHASKSEKQKTVTLACIYMFIILTVFLLLGSLILQFFGISLQSIRIAGGLIIGYMGFRMLFPADAVAADIDDQETKNYRTLAFTPLALPMLSGPGSISVVLAMATEIATVEDFTHRIIGYGVVGFGILLSSLICWLVLWSSGGVVRLLGNTGIEAITKLMGFLLVCIGAEFVVTGSGLG